MGDGDETGAPDDTADSDDAGRPDADDGDETGAPDASDAGSTSDDADQTSPDDADPNREESDGGPDEAEPTSEGDDEPDADESEESEPGAEEPEEEEGPRLFEPHPIDEDVPPGEHPREQEAAGEDDGEEAEGGDATITGEGAADEELPGNSSPLQGPAADQELPLTAHIEELLRRSVIVMVVVSVVSVATFPLGEEIINAIWNSALPGVNSRPRLYSPLELVVTQIKVASLAGLVVSMPVLVYQSYRFMRPGLYPHERRYYLAAVPTSLVLAFVGLVFGYFVMLPTIFTYFSSYSKDVADIAFALGRTFDLVLVLLGALVIIFQIPLFVMLALMMGLVTREWLADRRLIFWGSFLGISMLFSPDPTGMAPFILTATMIALFEGSLQLAKWTRRGRERLAR